jgi:hypothetical protein
VDEDSRVGDPGSLTELWLGRQVVIQHLADTPDGRRPVAKKEEMFLAAYNVLGAETQRSVGEPPRFIPWSAVLSIQGPPREEIEQEERGRQELMEQLCSARTESEIASAETAADSWLSSHPGDGDVRLARERLEMAPPGEDSDLEEGSPT